jgi:hypothetical protein
VTDTAAHRRVTFTLAISTVIGPLEDVQATVAYVADWLNDNGYGYVEVARDVQETDDAD